MVNRASSLSSDSVSSGTSAGAEQQKLLADILLNSEMVDQDNVIFPAAGTFVSVEGYLGAFTTVLSKPGSANREVIKSDLVLDLSAESHSESTDQTTRVFGGGCWRRGQFAWRHWINSKNWSAPLKSLVTFDVDTNICAHSRSGQIGCTRCLDTCPAQAIKPAGDSIEVDPHLCQGGGVLCNGLSNRRHSLCLSRRCGYIESNPARY